ncbi:MAG TPA: TraB/GumN family protein, partial [Microvirga sp.]|nr:TraB/GumN family protein [Microvirga sp.]
MKKLFAALLATIAAPAISADAPLPNVSPAMWVVKDADTTIYMFGTFHMLDGKRDWFNDEVKTAFDASNELVMEVVMPEDPAALQPLIMKHAIDQSGKPLSAKLKPEVKAKLDKELGTLGVPAAAMDKLEPWFVSMTLAAVGAGKLGLKPEHGPEKVLTKAAKEKGKPISAVETVEGQIAILDGMPEATQIASLTHTIEGMSKLGETFMPMLAAWSSGDTEALVKVMNSGLDNDPVVYKAMLTDRNSKWADWIGTRMEKPGTVFMAV